MGRCIFELPLHILLDLLASAILLLSILAQDCINSLLDRLLVTILTYLYDLADDDVFELVL